jgi:hypothetical protein
MKFKLLTLLFLFNLSMVNAQNGNLVTDTITASSTDFNTLDIVAKVMAAQRHFPTTIEANFQMQNGDIIKDYAARKLSGCIKSLEPVNKGEKDPTSNIWYRKYRYTIDKDYKGQDLKLTFDVAKQLIGDIIFLVTYNETNLNEAEKSIYNNAAITINAKLKDKNLRYYQANRLQNVSKDRVELVKLTFPNRPEYLAKMALDAQSPYVIELKDLKYKTEPAALKGKILTGSILISAYDYISSIGFYNISVNFTYPINDESLSQINAGFDIFISEKINALIVRIKDDVIEWASKDGPPHYYCFMDKDLDFFQQFVPLTDRIINTHGIKIDQNSGGSGLGYQVINFNTEKKFIELMRIFGNEFSKDDYFKTKAYTSLFNFGRCVYFGPKGSLNTASPTDNSNPETK